MKYPLDKFPYPKDSRSLPFTSATPDGGYVYVQNVSATVFGVPDEPHIHPKVLGGGQPANYAGDLTIQGGTVTDLTNLSGSFQFDSEEGLLEVADCLRRQGLEIEIGAIRLFPQDGSQPKILA